MNDLEAKTSAIPKDVSHETGVSHSSNPKKSRVGNLWKLFKEFLTPKGGVKTLKDLDIYVRFCISIAIIFTTAVLVIFTITGAEPSTLITCFFAMFGGEIFACAMIKLFKMKWRENDDGSDSNDSPCEQG